MYLSWFENYLNKRKYYISFENNKTDKLDIQCSVPQTSILGLLLFLIYINDLTKTSDVLMFVDDTNLFYSSNYIQYLYLTMNNELQNIVKWFSTNKFSLNLGKTKYSFFHKSSKKDGIQLRLPLFSINEAES